MSPSYNRPARAGCLRGALATTVLPLVAACGGDDPTTPSSPSGPEAPPGPVIDEAGTWTKLAPLRVPVNLAAATVYRGDIYVSGGYTDTLNSPPSTAAVQRYDPELDQWTRVADLPQAVGRHAMAVLRDTLLVIGGNISEERRSEGPPVQFGYKASSEVYAYDPEANRWALWSHLPYPLVGGEALVARDRLLVIGGLTAQQQHPPGDSILVSPGGGEWHRAPPPVDGLPRFPLTAVVGERVFVLTSSVRGPLFEFDPDSETWTSAASENFSDGDEGIGVAGRFHAIGSKHHAWSVSGGGEWSRLTSPPNPHLGVALAAIDDRLYVIGGAGDGARSTADVWMYQPPR